MTPVTIQAKSSQNGEPRVRDMLAETMKIPEPIIEPATSIVASVRVIALTNSGLACCSGFVDPDGDFGVATLVIQLLVIARDCDHQAADGEVCRKPVKNRAITREALGARCARERLLDVAPAKLLLRAPDPRGLVPPTGAQWSAGPSYAADGHREWCRRESGSRERLRGDACCNPRLWWA